MDPGCLFVTLSPLSFFSFPIDRPTCSDKDGEAKAKGRRQHDSGPEADEKGLAGQGDFNVRSKRDVSSRCTSCKENTEHSGAYVNIGSSDLLVLSWFNLQS